MRSFIKFIIVRYRAYRVEQARLGQMHDQFEMTGLYHIPNTHVYVNQLRSPR